MVSTQLLDYIRQRLAAGASKEEIIQSLVTVGWQGPDIRDAFSTIDTRPAPPQFPKAPAATAQNVIITEDPPHERSRWPVILIAVVALLFLSGGAAFAYYTLHPTIP
ncbi:MAG: cytochrome c-type biogenesis protein [Minisyncoccota bacterium]